MRSKHRDWTLEKWCAVGGFALAVVVAAVPFVIWAVNSSRATIAAGRPVCGMSRPAEPALVVGGYVVVDSAEGGQAFPALARSCNSSDAGNRVTRTGVGHYGVRLGKLGVDGGTVEVTAISDDYRICGAAGWGIAGAGPDLEAKVVCADEHGTPRDSGFALNFRRARPGAGPLAYLRYDNPPAKLFSPAPNYSFNSSGGAVSVERQTTAGDYKVYLQDMQGPLQRRMPGVAKVTSLGPESRICNPIAWNAWTSAHSHKHFLVVWVHCTDVAGVPAESRFSLTYSAQPAARPDQRSAGAQLRADRALAWRYTPTDRYAYNSTGESIMIERAGPGRYAVQLSGFDGDHGMAQVSAFNSDATCAVTHSTERLPDSTTVGVRCWRHGRPADAEFVMLHQP